MKKLVTIILGLICALSLIACNKECAHTFANGECSKCGQACTHSFATDGNCSFCGKECAHSYEESVCLVCGKECSHTYSEGVCSVCGKEDVHYIPVDKGASLYDKVIEDFNELILYKYTFEELPPISGDEPYYFGALYEVATYYDPSIDIGYATKDINGDGWAELMLMERSCRLNAIFTLVNKRPTLVKVFQTGMGYLSVNGVVFYNEKVFDEQMRQLRVENHVKRLVQAELVGIEYGKYDTDDNFDTDDDAYYFVSESGEESALTKDEYSDYSARYEYYWSYATRQTRLCGLRFNSSLLEQAVSVPSADFSTYDGIIDTLNKMYLSVGKSTTYFKKTSWTSGAYDKGMKFASDEDFYLYNRLIGAITCIKAPTSTTTYGYALKDLNDDSVEELILLDSNFVVLAIFTEKEDKAVLLDVFSEWHEACIDANGLIRVKDKAIPGYAKDELYYVYSVDGVTLKSNLAISCVYDGSKSGSQQVAWYKTVNGEKILLSQDEWNGLYAEWLTDIGDTEFYTYTEENANLVFEAL